MNTRLSSLLLALGLVACGASPAPLPTYTPYPTYTPPPKQSALQTSTPVPSATQPFWPTRTRVSTFTSEPTKTPTAIPSATPKALIDASSSAICEKYNSLTSLQFTEYIKSLQGQWTRWTGSVFSVSENTSGKPLVVLEVDDPGSCCFYIVAFNPPKEEALRLSKGQRLEVTGEITVIFGNDLFSLMVRSDNFSYLPLDSPTPTQAPTSMPAVNALGEKLNPIPLGQTAGVKWGQHMLDVTLLETKRGQPATDEINRDSVLKFSPSAGYEHLIARFRVKCTSGPQDSTAYGDLLDFAIDANHELRGVTVVTMKEELRFSLYPGGESTGWVAFSVPLGSPIGGIRFAQGYTSMWSVWFALQ